MYKLSLASHTLCRERKGLVMLQLMSCHQRILNNTDADIRLCCCYSMTTDAIYKEHSLVTYCGDKLQHDQTLPLSAKGGPCKTDKSCGGGEVKFVFTSTVKIFSLYAGSLGDS